jgi:hypothetical protein
MAKHGICHIEWSVTDLKRAQAFYGGLFGWEFEAWGESENYVLFTTPNISGGLVKCNKIQPGESPRIFVEVDEIESYLRQAQKLGGKVITAKTQIDPKIGWFALLTDPDGNTIGLFQGVPK